jgi:hypothetical protein
MKHHSGITGLVALALVVVTVTGCRADLGGGAVLRRGCCVDLGVRLTLSLRDGAIRGALVLPLLTAGQEAPDGPAARLFGLCGRELVSVTLGASDIVRWGIPAVSTFVGVRSAMRSAREQTGLRGEGN